MGVDRHGGYRDGAVVCPGSRKYLVERQMHETVFLRSIFIKISLQISVLACPYCANGHANLTVCTSTRDSSQPSSVWASSRLINQPSCIRLESPPTLAIPNYIIAFFSRFPLVFFSPPQDRPCQPAHSLHPRCLSPLHSRLFQDHRNAVLTHRTQC